MLRRIEEFQKILRVRYVSHRMQQRGKDNWLKLCYFGKLFCETSNDTKKIAFYTRCINFEVITRLLTRRFDINSVRDSRNFCSMVYLQDLRS